MTKNIDGTEVTFYMDRDGCLLKRRGKTTGWMIWSSARKDWVDYDPDEDPATMTSPIDEATAERWMQDPTYRCGPVLET
ncbi:MAG: hypothetical protein SGI77_00635 [Pirellulaceae bacterium]|nr:hypothetical protein [Pirellulaceae bacterium]